MSQTNCSWCDTPWGAVHGPDCPHAGTDRPVRRDEPHWYLTIIEEGCVLCNAGGQVTRVRMAGEKPKDPADRYRHESATWACGSHFC